MKSPSGFSLLVALLASMLFPTLGFGDPEPAAATPLVDYVRPLVGTHGEGDTYPGPTAPFGMVQLSPDTDRNLCSGYAYTDPTILGLISARATPIPTRRFSALA
jgi:putative alpha-1,2-mannosidase